MTRKEWDSLKYGDILRYRTTKPLGPVDYMFIRWDRGGVFGASPVGVILAAHKTTPTSLNSDPAVWDKV